METQQIAPILQETAFSKPTTPLERISWAVWNRGRAQGTQLGEQARAYLRDMRFGSTTEDPAGRRAYGTWPPSSQSKTGTVAARVIGQADSNYVPNSLLEKLLNQSNLQTASGFGSDPIGAHGNSGGDIAPSRAPPRAPAPVAPAVPIFVPPTLRAPEGVLNRGHLHYNKRNQTALH